MENGIQCAKHREDLLALQRSDPDFYDYLNQTDQSLLSFGVEQEQGAFKDEDDDTADGEHGEDDKALPPVKAKPHSSVLVEVTSEMVRGWEKRLMSSEHTASLKELVAAFRAAVRFGDSETSEDEVFTFSSARVFNELMNMCLQSMDDMLKRHVAGGASAVAVSWQTKGGVERPDQWAHWRRHQPYVKSFLFQLTQFIGQLTEASMVALTLQQVHRLLPFFYALPKLCPTLLKAVLQAWGADESSGGSRQITALACAPMRTLRTGTIRLSHVFRNACVCFAISARTDSRPCGSLPSRYPTHSSSSA